MNVDNTIEVYSCNHFCNRKAVSITYVKCVFVAVSIQVTTRMRHIAICGLPGSTIFFHIILYAARFSKRVMEHKICVLILSTTLVLNISHSKNWARYDQKCILTVM